MDIDWQPLRKRCSLICSIPVAGHKSMAKACCAPMSMFRAWIVRGLHPARPVGRPEPLWRTPWAKPTRRMTISFASCSSFSTPHCKPWSMMLRTKGCQARQLVCRPCSPGSGCPGQTRSQVRTRAAVQIIAELMNFAQAVDYRFPVFFNYGTHQAISGREPDAPAVHLSHARCL